MTGSWRVALRLARRDVAEHRLRTALTATLVGLPVLFSAALTAVALGSNDVVFASVVYLPIAVLIVLLAIPAFGVTARTRREQLVLIESTGGTPADLRRVVASVGLLTGLLAVVAAFSLAVPTWIALVAIINRLDPGQSTVASVSDLILWPLLAIFSVAASVIAAVVTAYTVPATTSGSGDSPSPILLLTGCGITIVGLIGTVSVAAGEITIAPWTTLLVVGVVLIVPTVVHLIGRVAGRLPLAARLSARDADRHRSRTAPAIAAVMAGVAAVTALGIGSSSDATDRQAEDYIYTLPPEAVTVYGESDAITQAISSAPEGLNLVPLAAPSSFGGYLTLPVTAAGASDTAFASRDFVVADADTLAAWGVDLGPQETAALDEGTALVGPAVQLTNREVRTTQGSDGSSASQVSFDAVRADLSVGPVPSGAQPTLANVVIPPQLAEALDISSEANEAIVDRRGPAPTAVQVSALRDLPDISVDTQEPEPLESGLIILSLLTLLGLAVVGLATATAVALARIDSREDASTLVSMGASMSTRRWTAATSALLIGGLGSVLGVAVGFVPGVRSARALTGGYGEEFLTIPWAMLAIVGIGFPLVIAAIAFLIAGREVAGPSDGLR